MGLCEIEFVVVDVFASRPLTGNPLTLVSEGDGLDEGQMRAIAREFNQSETTFVLPATRRGARWRLRSFTPAGVEVAGAGHNALGAWLAHAGRVSAGRFVQQIGQEMLPMEIIADVGEPMRVAMDQSPPVFGTVIDTSAPLAAALGIQERDLDASQPSQVVSTGAAHLLVAVRDRAVVDRVDVDPRALLAVLGPGGAEGCYVYTTAAPMGSRDDGAHAYAPFFNPTVGITEDPATGTAAGPLAAALVRAGRILDGSTVHVEQGHAIGRPSRLQVEVRGDLVQLSGSRVVAGHGWLNV